jgi:ATP synthase F1 gamma subunit
MQLTEIRKELKFNVELVQLIETLKNIAAQEYHMMEKEKERFDLFMDAFSGFFRVVNLVAVDDPLVKVVSDVLGVIVVTSDSGFMGGLNQGVMRMAATTQGDIPSSKVALVVIGDKGASWYSDQAREFKFFKSIGPPVTEDKIYALSVEIKDYIVQEVLARRMGKVVVVYPKPVSFSAQTIEVINLLPCAELFNEDAESEVARRFAGKGVIGEASKVIVESSYSDMVEYLSGTWVESKLYEVFEDSKLAEFSARAMHLEGSYQKLDKDLKKIKHMAFKAAHEQIDKGMRESFSAKGGRVRRQQKKDAS